ncbi:hypothetical protein BDQ17DRAFT_953308 [Cyathus striatus]|nr:hypothetical protein BDQ17DRAFT_953308 [Cyathus striatus]
MTLPSNFRHLSTSQRHHSPTSIALHIFGYCYHIKLSRTSHRTRLCHCFRESVNRRWMLRLKMSTWHSLPWLVVPSNKVVLRPRNGVALHLHAPQTRLRHATYTIILLITIEATNVYWVLAAFVVLSVPEEDRSCLSALPSSDCNRSSSLPPVSSSDAPDTTHLFSVSRILPSQITVTNVQDMIITLAAN